MNVLEIISKKLSVNSSGLFARGSFQAAKMTACAKGLTNLRHPFSSK